MEFNSRFTLHYYSGSRHVNNLKKETIIQIDTKVNLSITDDSDNAITSPSENSNSENNDEVNFLMKIIQTKYLKILWCRDVALQVLMSVSVSLLTLGSICPIRYI